LVRIQQGGDSSMRKITVEPEQLESCALRMETRNQDYTAGCASLFSAVDSMGSSWRGKDNAAFVSQISKYQTDFRQMSVLCTQYSDFLRNSARAYRDTQDELTSQAGYLAR
jgi:WXG100 family type VII secretion target